MRHRVTIVIEHIEIAGETDIWPFSATELVLSARVHEIGRADRPVCTRLPSCGTYRCKPGERLRIDGTIFSDEIEGRDVLVIRLSAIDVDPLFSDALGTFERRLAGPVEEWDGTYTPDDEPDDPEDVGPWRVWYRVEIEASASSDDDEDDEVKRDRVPMHRPHLEAALAQKRRLRPRDPSEIDPAVEAPEGAALITDEKTVELPLCEPPDAPSSFGTVGRFVRVPGESLTGRAVITIAVDRDRLTGIDPASVRLLRFSERRGQWAPTATSGLGFDSTYVVAEVTAPGLYGVFGAPADRARSDTLRTLHRLMPWMAAEREMGVAGAPLIDRLCQVILCAPFMEKLAPGARAGFGLSPRTRGWKPRPRYRPGARGGPGMPPGPESGPEGVPPGAERFPSDPPPEAWPRGDICDQCLGRRTGPDLPGRPGRPDGRPPDVVIVAGEDEHCRTWEVAGPLDYGGRVKALAFHSGNPSIVYMGNAQGGVFKSTNAGASWTPMDRGLVNTSFGALAVHPTNGNIVYAGTAEFPNGGSGYNAGIGIYRSDDAGATWTLLPTPVNARYDRIILHPDDPDIVYAIGLAGVERSSNAGEDWEVILGGRRCTDAVLDPTDPDRLIVAVEDDDVFLETHLARESVVDDWAPLTAGLDLGHRRGSKYRRLAASTRSDGSLVLWGKSNAQELDSDGDSIKRVHVYRWSNDDAEWQLRRSAKGNTQGLYNCVLEIDPHNPDIVFTAERGLAWTTDAGTTWESIDTGHSDVHCIAFDPADAQRFLVGNDGGVFSIERPAPGTGITSPTPTDATTWTDSNAGNVTLEFRNCSASRFGALTVAGSTQDQYVHALQSGGFRRIRGTENGPVEVWPADGDTIWWDPGGGPAYGIQSTRDGGDSVRFAGSGTYFWTGKTRVLRIHPTDRRFGLAAIDARNGQALPCTIFRTENGAGEPDENFARLPHAALDGLGDFTFSAWIATQDRRFEGSATYNSGHYAVISGANASRDNELLLFRRGADPKADAPEEKWETFLRGEKQEWRLPARIEDGLWHHVCWVRTGSGQRLYVDGTALVHDASGETEGPAPADRIELDADGLVLGQEQDSVGGGFDYSQAYQGRMRDVRVFDSALSASQVGQLAAGAEPGVGATHAWPFSTDAHDAAGSLDATLVGTRLHGDAEGVDFAAFYPVWTGSTIAEAPPSLLAGATDFTVGLWIRPADIGPYALISAASEASDNEFLLYVPDSTRVEVIFGSTSRRFVASTPLDPHAWHHVVVAREGTAVRVWVGGRPLTSEAGNPEESVPGDPLQVDVRALDYNDDRAFTPRGGLLIGQEQDAVGGDLAAYQAFAGLLDELAVYDVALDDAQVSALYASGASGAESTLRGRYRFDGNGDDDSGNERHLVLPPDPVYEPGISTPALRFRQPANHIYDIAYAPSSPARIYAGDSIGRLWVSDDGGLTWSDRTGAIAGQAIRCIAVDWDDPDRIVIGYHGPGIVHLWRSDDAGRSWVDAAGDRPAYALPQELGVRDIVIDYDDDHTFYVATVIGVFRSRDEGRSWESFDQGLPNAAVTRLQLRVANNTLYASTYGRAIWQRELG